jgi:hypothetical protein
MREPGGQSTIMMTMDFWLFWQWNDALFVVEALLVVASLAFTCRLAGAERAFQRLARHRLAPLAAGLFALVLRAAVLPVEPVPSPSVHDEFSYLLAADTFAHGRLANPTHPMWEHFETFHENQLPTYASMYPPLEGLVLAAGQVITGSPFTGVWLSAGAMCAVLVWALRGWFPPGWALLGGAIAAIRLAMFSYWGNSYWGGALAATGGALVFGALPRLLRSSRPKDALLAALGVAMLANARPYEGFVFSLAVGLVALWQVRKLRLRAILPPVCAVLVCAGAFMAYYNWRVYGSPATLPYTVNRNTYAVAPVFLFQSLHPEPVYRHDVMREFYTGWEVQVYESARTLKGFFLISIGKLYVAWNFFIGPVLTLPLVALAWTWRSRRTRILLFLAASMVVATSVVPFFMPHYIAPATAVIYALILQGMRALSRAWPRAARAILPICAAMVVVRLALAAASVPLEPGMPVTWFRNWPAPLGRETIAAELLAKGGPQLVIVRYHQGHDTGSEYVYNAAAIDASPIVWARDMGPEKNAELVRYFSSRKVWLLDVNPEPVLYPYGAAR